MQNIKDIQEIDQKQVENALLLNHCNEKPHQYDYKKQYKIQNAQSSVKKEDNSGNSGTSTFSDGENNQKQDKGKQQNPQKDYGNNQNNSGSNEKSGNSNNEESVQKNEVPGNTSTHSKHQQSNSNKSQSQSQSTEKESEDSSSSYNNKNKRKYPKKRNLLKKTYFKQDYKLQEDYIEVVKIKKNLWKNLSSAFFSHLQNYKLDLEPILKQRGIKNLKTFFLKYSMKRIQVNNRQNFLKHFFPTSKQQYMYETSLQAQKRILSKIVKEEHQDDSTENKSEDTLQQSLEEQKQEKNNLIYKNTKCHIKYIKQQEFQNINQFQEYISIFKNYKLNPNQLRQLQQEELNIENIEIKVEHQDQQQQQLSPQPEQQQQSSSPQNQQQQLECLKQNENKYFPRDSSSGSSESNNQNKRKKKGKKKKNKQNAGGKSNSSNSNNSNNSNEVDMKTLQNRIKKIENTINEKSVIRRLLLNFLRCHLFQFCTQKSKIENVYLFLQQRHYVQLEINKQQQRNSLELMMLYEEEKNSEN